MPMPKGLEALIDHGVVEQVVRPLRSGKEAEVYLVVSEGALRVAKVYKEATHRTFRHRATYTEGRRVRNSRDQRAMAKRTSHGKAQDEAAWRSTEVDMIYKLEAAGVRVPAPYHYVDGILIMELVQTAVGEPAPRLGELPLSAGRAEQLYKALLAEVVRMLCAGVVHGDLSEFNVLVDQHGPCIIDFPQAVHAASNANARKLLLRDVGNLHHFLQRFKPGHTPAPYAEEMWQLYERGELMPTTQLTGTYRPTVQSAEVDVVMAIIEEAKREERQRQERTGGESRGYARKKAERARVAESAPAPDMQAPKSPRSSRSGDRSGERPSAQSQVGRSSGGGDVPRRSAGRPERRNDPRRNDPRRGSRPASEEQAGAGRGGRTRAAHGGPRPEGAMQQGARAQGRPMDRNGSAGGNRANPPSSRGHRDQGPQRPADAGQGHGGERGQAPARPSGQPSGEASRSRRRVWRRDT